MAVGDIIKSTDLDSKLSTSGGTLSGALGMGGNKITNLATPTGAQTLRLRNTLMTK